MPVNVYYLILFEAMVGEQKEDSPSSEDQLAAPAFKRWFVSRSDDFMMLDRDHTTLA